MNFIGNIKIKTFPENENKKTFLMISALLKENICWNNFNVKKNGFDLNNKHKFPSIL